MYQVRAYKQLDTILQNPTLWNKVTIDETTHRFRNANQQVDGTFDSKKKIRNDVRSLSDFTLPEWVR